MPVLWKEEKVEKRIVDYKVTVAVLRSFLNQKLLTDSEFQQAEQLIANKYGISLGSIFREIA